MAVNPTIVELVRPGCDKAIDRALHDANPYEFHKRITGMCPLCLTITERFKKLFVEHASDSPRGKMLADAMKKFMEAQDAAE